MRKLVLAAAAVAAIPTVAPAATFDIAGDYGASVFQYGSGTGVTFTPFANVYASGCAGVATFACRTNAGNALGVSDLPAAGVNTGSTAFTVGTVTIPTGVLFLHPGEDAAAGNAILQFTAPTTGYYTASGSLSRLDNTSSGNGIIAAVFLNGVLIPASLTPLGPTGTPVTGGPVGFALTAGDTLRFVVNNNNDVFFDSTGLSGQISVPEPASWALMIGGIGLVGGSLRARRRSVRFAAA